MNAPRPTLTALVADRVKAAQDLTYWQDHGTYGDGNLQDATRRMERSRAALSRRIARLEELASIVLAKPGTLTREDRERKAVELAEAVLALDSENDGVTK